MPGSRFSSSTRPSSSAWVVEGCSSSFTECNPNSRHILSFERTYAREAGLSPTRITARPGVTPFAFSSAISRRRSTYTFSAIARPSINFAILKQAILPAGAQYASIALAASLWDAQRSRCKHFGRASHREAATEDRSAHFNQRHHGVLQAQTLGFKFFRSAYRSDAVWRANDHADLCEQSRNDKSVPAFDPPAI